MVDNTGYHFGLLKLPIAFLLVMESVSKAKAWPVITHLLGVLIGPKGPGFFSKADR